MLFALNAINGGNQATTGNNTDLITGAKQELFKPFIKKYQFLNNYCLIVFSIESVPVESVEETENAEESTVAA